MPNYYDFEKVNREVPIEDVLSFFGIHPNSKGWYSIRSEDDTPSAHIDKERRYGNTIHDFGASNTFTPISLTMYLKGVDRVEASQILGDAFNIEPIKRDKTNPDVVSNWEWERINIQPDMSSKNMDFYPDKYGAARTQAYAENYRMSINALKNSDLKMYERILRSRAIPYVLDMRSNYYRTMYNEYSLYKSVSSDFDNDKVVKERFDDFKKLATELTNVESILKKAIKGTSIKFPLKQCYNVETDYYKVVNGEVSFEIGNDSYFSISRAAFQDKVQVFSCNVSLSDYFKLVDNGLNNIHVSATQKGENVQLAFSSNDSSRVHYLGRALLGKGIDIGKVVAQNHVDVDKGSQKDVVKDTTGKVTEQVVSAPVSQKKEPPMDIG